MNYGRRLVTLIRRRGSRPSPKREMQKGKMMSEVALQIAVKRGEAKAKEKRKDISM